jgi:16S rRNA (cytosine1402-N4)-methyltransferase
MAEGRGPRADQSEAAIGRAASTILLNDADASNLARAAANVQAVAGTNTRVLPFHGNFADLPRKMQEAGLAADMLLADLGFASNQVDDAARGFSFMREGPLDMRLDPSRPLSAADLVNKASETELLGILRDYAEEPAARRIASAIVRARKAAPLLTTTALADLVKATIGHRPGANHPATKTFQGLRIAVNDELGSLEALLAAIRQAAIQIGESSRAGSPCHLQGKEATWLRPGARVAIITFHSLEDRPVKRVFTELVKEALAEEIGRGKCAASDEEIAQNPRARSAKLRAIRLIPPTMPK